MIDEGETDWKLIAIDIKDPDSHRLKSLTDVEEIKPGLLNATVEWFRKYKIPEGKPENKFAFGGQPKEAAFAKMIVDEVHENWKDLMNRDDSLHKIHRSCTKCKFKTQITSEEAIKVVRKEALKAINGPPPSIIDVYHYC